MEPFTFRNSTREFPCYTIRQFALEKGVHHSRPDLTVNWRMLPAASPCLLSASMCGVIIPMSLQNMNYHLTVFKIPLAKTISFIHGFLLGNTSFHGDCRAPWVKHGCSYKIYAAFLLIRMKILLISRKLEVDVLRFIHRSDTQKIKLHFFAIKSFHLVTKNKASFFSLHNRDNIFSSS